MSNGFEDYPRPSIGGRVSGGIQGQTGSPEKTWEPTGGFLPALGIAAVGAIGTYFSTRAQIKAQERMGEKSWRHQLELERMRIEAMKELDRERRTLDPAIYAMLKKELLTPSAPHGMGGGRRPQTGGFREMVEGQQVKPQPTRMGGGGQGFDLNKFLTGGGR